MILFVLFQRLITALGLPYTPELFVNTLFACLPPLGVTAMCFGLLATPASDGDVRRPPAWKPGRPEDTSCAMSLDTLILA
ncbi:hypothetical protein BDW22DRAFT_524193 [Trametopsis cervina]|nr:hypothetical protein BDW22DRAFT_524193 [Trametopsis cervina]